MDMKRLLLSVVYCCGLAGLSKGQTNCNAGYETPTFSGIIPVPANTIFTLTANAANPGTLTGISFTILP